MEIKVMSCGGCSYTGMSTEVEDSFVGVRFGEETNLTLCSTGGARYARGDRVMVEVDKGLAQARVVDSPMPVFKPCQKSAARRVVRLADAADMAAHEQKILDEVKAKAFAREKVRELNLKMKISKVELTLDGRHASFYFTADKRVDFRKLVRELGRRLSRRVRMIQIGSRDEAGLLGGVGICGRTLCCSTWLRDFRPISIQMAKRQNLSLNPSKISGQCGRLLCCLAYEDENYKKPKDESLTPLRRQQDSPGGAEAGA